MIKYLPIYLLLTGCVASQGVNQECEQINDTMRICRDRVHTNHCRLFIERNEPYPNTITDLFWCADTGYIEPHQGRR